MLHIHEVSRARLFVFQTSYVTWAVYQSADINNVINAYNTATVLLVLGQVFSFTNNEHVDPSALLPGIIPKGVYLQTS